MKRKCERCGEHRIIQDDPSDLGYDFVVFGCYSQYYIYPDGGMTLVYQGDRCKDKVISSLTNYNQLTPGEAERLAWLLEELGEVQQIVGKILRHGYESRWPPETGHTNREKLHRELRDVIFVLELMYMERDIDVDKITNILEEKKYENCYLHHQEI